MPGPGRPCHLNKDFESLERHILLAFLDSVVISVFAIVILSVLGSLFGVRLPDPSPRHWHIAPRHRIAYFSDSSG